MLKLKFFKKDQGTLRVMFLGAHSDDIEIGCGGTVLRLIDENPEIEIVWVVFSALGERGEEARKSAQEFLKDVQNKRIVVHEFKDGYFPHRGAEIKDIFEQLKQEFVPDIVFTHYRHDLHQDHRVLNELTWNTWRNHFILEYEIPKYDGDLQAPNFFIHLDAATCQQKIDYLMQYFATQTNRYWFTPETFQGLMRVRGVESRAPGGYAEGFYCRKVVI